MLLEALVLPGNKILPLGGIIAMGVTPALLVVTRGKIIRMIIIGAVELPLFLWAGTLTAPFVTKTAKAVGAFPTGVAKSTLISHSTMEGPIEKDACLLSRQCFTRRNQIYPLRSIGPCRLSADFHLVRIPNEEAQQGIC